MSGGNKNIKNLCDLAVDPELAVRFERLVLLTQRTRLIGELLSLDWEDSLIKRLTRQTFEKKELTLKTPRGSGFDLVSSKSISPADRYDLTFLLNLLYSVHLNPKVDTLASGTEAGGRYRLLDRLIYVYQTYQRTFRVGQDARVHFEKFHAAYLSFNSHDLGMEPCRNCSSLVLNFGSGPRLKCPVCQSHGHAVIPGKMAADLRIPSDDGHGSPAARPTELRLASA